MTKAEDNFVENRIGLHPYPTNDIDEFFRNYVKSRSKDDLRCLCELDLQAYLYLNRKKIYPECVELILYERPLIDETSTNTGCYDFVFLTDQGKIRIIETKYLDFESTGHTASCRRRRHRQKVVQQVLRGKEQLSFHFDIPEEYIACAVFTNDPEMEWRLKSQGLTDIESRYVYTHALRQWLKNKKSHKVVEG